MSGNDYVTERELQAHLNPVKEDIWEIKADVKTILLSQAGVQALQKNSKDVGARRLAWGSILAAAIGSLWWVQDAFARLTHH